MDRAHQWTEQQIAAMEQRFKSVYQDAQRTAQNELVNYLDKFKKLDEGKREELERGEISEDEYRKWRKSKMLRKSQLKSTVDEMAKAYYNADKLTMGYLRGELPMIFGANFDYGACETFGMKWSFKLYDQRTVARLIATDPKMLPDPRPDKYKDTEWYRKKINSAVTQGILQGHSIPKIVKNSLNPVTKSARAAALRNVRTAVTGAECAGRVESYQWADQDGVQMVQVWQATLDGRTRHSHAAIDGEEIAVGSTFSNGCKYPGDPNGEPSEVYNCRCTIVGHVKGYEKYHKRGKYGNGKLGDESYDEWKQRHIEALERKHGNGK